MRLQYFLESESGAETSRAGFRRRSFRGEFQLTSCLDRLRKEERVIGLIVKGRRFDIGNPDAYWNSIVELRKAGGTAPKGASAGEGGSCPGSHHPIRASPLSNQCAIITAEQLPALFSA